MIKNQDALVGALQITDDTIGILDYLLENQVIPQDGAVVEGLSDNLENLGKLVDEVQKELPTINFSTTVENIRYILNKSIDRADLRILEYNTIPLLEELRYMLYYWGAVYPDRDKIDAFLKEEVGLYCGNLYINQAEEKGEYRYDLSISVLAYNNLKYTKMCIESILATVPEDIKYELILINHGSTDGTQQYFENIKADKIFELHVNNGNYSAVSRIIEGKYHIQFSNDVLALPNAIRNMMRLAEEDPKVAYIVPSTPNVSNLQTIPAYYEEYADMLKFAIANNVYNPYKHEQRVRLCNPVTFSPSRHAISSKYGVFAGRYQYSADFTSFGDDRISLVYRRHGLKCVLQKDAYCHHFGSVTIKNEEALKKEADYYAKGRVQFEELFGVDPWGTGFCWEPDLFDILPCDKDGKVTVLGLNCGMGSNSLKVKENLKEQQQNLDVKLLNITDDGRYEKDLAGISDKSKVITDKAEIIKQLKKNKYDYVVWEDCFGPGVDPQEVADVLTDRINPKGYIAVHEANGQAIEVFKKDLKYRENGNWFVFRK